MTGLGGKTGNLDTQPVLDEDLAGDFAEVTNKLIRLVRGLDRDGAGFIGRLETWDGSPELWKITVLRIDQPDA